MPAPKADSHKTTQFLPFQPPGLDTKSRPAGSDPIVDIHKLVQCATRDRPTFSDCLDHIGASVRNRGLQRHVYAWRPDRIMSAYQPVFADPAAWSRT